MNRGVDKRRIFMEDKDYFRFQRSMLELNQPEPIESLYRQDQLRRQSSEATKSLRLASANRSDLVAFIAFCLNPNHFHLLVKQSFDNGISKFMHKLGLGYTGFVNAKYQRSGSLFQSTFKAVPVKTQEQLIYVSAYINGNPEIHKIAKADKWQYSSYEEYLKKKKSGFCCKAVVLNDFEDAKDYQNYVNNVIERSRDIKEEMKICLID